MSNKQNLYRIISVFAIIIGVSAVNFFVTKYYVRKIVDQEIKNRSMGAERIKTDQIEERGNEIVKMEAVEEELKNKVMNLNEISGKIIEVGNDYVKIKTSGDVLTGISDQVFIFDYLRDRTAKIAQNTRISKEEVTSKGDVVVVEKKISDLRQGDYVVASAKEAIGSKSEFIADVLRIAF